MTGKKVKRPDTYARNVFINCPFDDGYIRLFDAAAFTVIACGFVARCALEIDDGSEVRIEKIFKIISECKFGVHDLSRTELDAAHLLPRFNMPLELGIFLGAKRFGAGAQRSKSALIMDTDRFRYQKLVSDIAGQDIRDHGGEMARAIGNVRNWLASTDGMVRLPGQEALVMDYSKYLTDLPWICEEMRLSLDELTFNDKVNIMNLWSLASESPN